MKLKCSVTAVEDCGDTLRVRLQGKSPTDADWRAICPQVIEIANSGGANRAFYVGRQVIITVQPR